MWRPQHGTRPGRDAARLRAQGWISGAAFVGARRGTRCRAAHAGCPACADGPLTARCAARAGAPGPCPTPSRACAGLLSQPLRPPVAGGGGGVAQDERATGGGVEAHHPAARLAGGAPRACIAPPQDHRTAQVQPPPLALRPPAPASLPSVPALTRACPQFKWRADGRTEGRRAGGIAGGGGALPGAGRCARL